MNPHKVAIFGSCQGRDTVDAWPTSLELTSYVARQALTSAMHPAPLAGLTVSHVPAGWRRAQYAGDVRSSAMEVLTADLDTRVIWWDLTDERNGVARYNGGWITRSEYMPAGCTDHTEFGTREHFDLFCDSLDIFLAELDEIGWLSKLVVNGCEWAYTDEAGAPIAGAARFNTNARRYWREIDRHAIAILETTATVADSTSRWGRQPFHLDRTTHERQVNSLLHYLEA